MEGVHCRPPFILDTQLSQAACVARVDATRFHNSTSMPRIQPYRARDTNRKPPLLFRFSSFRVHIHIYIYAWQPTPAVPAVCTFKSCSCRIPHSDVCTHLDFRPVTFRFALLTEYSLDRCFSEPASTPPQHLPQTWRTSRPISTYLYICTVHTRTSCKINGHPKGRRARWLDGWCGVH